MVSNLQFAGVAAYLLWCLFSSLSGMLSDRHDRTEVRLTAPRSGAKEG